MVLLVGRNVLQIDVLVIVAAVTIAAGGEDPLKEVEELIRGATQKGCGGCAEGRSGWLQNLGEIGG